MVLENLIEVIRTEVEKDQKLSKCSVFLCRQDGVVLFSTIESAQKHNESSIGALVSGVWQAANSLSGFISADTEKIFRLSFDTSDSGVYILNINYDGSGYYLGVLFNDEINPGLLKSKVRGLSDKVDNLEVEGPSSSCRLDEPLFENITDAEIDDMFSTAGI